MSRKVKKSYKFALRTSISLTLLLLLLAILALWWYDYLIEAVPYLLVATILVLFLSFSIIQFRIEKFIYRRIKNLYDDIALLESASFTSKPVVTDMTTLTSEIERFAQKRKIELETLKIQDEYRKEFLGNISHELKTPLFTVQGYILTLLDGAMTDKSVRKKYLQRANKGVERLIYIIKDLDLISKLEIGEMNLEREDFDIVEVIQNVFDLLEINASKRDINLMFDQHYDQKIMVNADKEKIQQIVSNLLVNSIKYGHDGGITEVSIEDLIQNKVIVRITDNGEGIHESHIPRIFERFYRVDKSGSRKAGGSGLGLSIVKHIIEAHGEKIYVESKEDVGSEFSFTLEKTQTENIGQQEQTQTI
ncbi:MAG: sensor histidine kinase [Eudoraea sp.]|nr:sensor histidine kinase [Eudoraea sp.]